MQVAFYLAGEITQVLDPIPWVRCASGNVSLDILSHMISRDELVDIPFHQHRIVLALILWYIGIL